MYAPFCNHAPSHTLRHTNYSTIFTKKEPADCRLFFCEPEKGLEPLTFSLRMKCSTD